MFDSDALIALTLLLDAYAIVFFRLMCSYHYQQANDVKESPLGAIFSFPPHRRLNARGKHYSRRYWLALAILALIVGWLAMTRDYSQLGAISTAAP